MGVALNLNESVLYNLSCLEQGIDSKSVVYKNILKAVASSLIDVVKELKPEESPAALLQILHERIGLTVVIHNGIVTDILFEQYEEVKKGA